MAYLMCLWTCRVGWGVGLLHGSGPWHGQLLVVVGGGMTPLLPHPYSPACLDQPHPSLQPHVSFHHAHPHSPPAHCIDPHPPPCHSRSRPHTPHSPAHPSPAGPHPCHHSLALAAMQGPSGCPKVAANAVPIHLHHHRHYHPRPHPHPHPPALPSHPPPPPSPLPSPPPPLSFPQPPTPSLLPQPPLFPKSDESGASH